MFRRQFVAAVLGSALIALSAGAAAAEQKKEPFPGAGKVTVVDFGAPWCAGCPETEQVMRDLQKEYGDKVAFVIINVDEYRGIEDKYLIETMPSQMFYDKTGEPIWIHKGQIDHDTLRERVNILLEGPDESEKK